MANEQLCGRNSMKNKRIFFQFSSSTSELRQHTTSMDKAKNQFRMACAAALPGAIFCAVELLWGSVEPAARPVGRITQEMGKVASKGSSLKADSSIFSYTVNVPSKYPDYIAKRTIYARKGACNRERLVIGETVLLTSHDTNGQKSTRSAVTALGCVLQDEALLTHMWKANKRDGAVPMILSGLAVAYFIIAGIVEWLRARPKRGRTPYP